MFKTCKPFITGSFHEWTEWHLTLPFNEWLSFKMLFLTNIHISLFPSHSWIRVSVSLIIRPVTSWHIFVLFHYITIPVFSMKKTDSPPYLGALLYAGNQVTIPLKSLLQFQCAAFVLHHTLISLAFCFNCAGLCLIYP